MITYNPINTDYSTNYEINDLSYIAGLIDGEGWIGIVKAYGQEKHNPCYKEVCQVKMVDKEPLLLLKKIFGGSIHFGKAGGKKYHYKRIWQYRASDLIAIRILKAIYPFVKIKKSAIDNCMELRKIKGNKYNYDEKKDFIKEQEKLWKKSKTFSVNLRSLDYK